MIYLAADHRGFKMKEKIKAWLTAWNEQYEDCGAFTYNEEDDYPDFIHVAARKVADDPLNSRAIILGGSGEGEAMVANRYKGVRATVYYGGPIELVAISRRHNASNVLSIGAVLGLTIEKSEPLPEDQVRAVVKAWLDEPFLAEPRHIRRIEKIDHLL